MELKIGTRVRCGEAGALHGKIGVITTGGLRGHERRKIYIRWDGNVMSNGYFPDSNMVESLQPVEVVRHRETTVSVAQFISMAIENEIRDPGRLDYADVTEVGAELHHLLGGNQEFKVKTADGKTFTIRVSED